MSDKLDETIQAIAVRHGVVLGKNDPVLILQTMHERLLEESRKAQQDMLIQFREEMENISSQWKDVAKEKAENILNTALSVSKDAMARLLRDSIGESVQTMKKVMADSLKDGHDMMQQTRKIRNCTLIVLPMILGSISLFSYFF